MIGLEWQRPLGCKWHLFTVVQHVTFKNNKLRHRCFCFFFLMLIKMVRWNFQSESFPPNAFPFHSSNQAAVLLCTSPPGHWADSES